MHVRRIEDSTIREPGKSLILIEPLCYEIGNRNSAMGIVVNLFFIPYDIHPYPNKTRQNQSCMGGQRH